MTHYIGDECDPPHPRIMKKLDLTVYSRSEMRRLHPGEMEKRDALRRPKLPRPRQGRRNRRK